MKKIAKSNNNSEESESGVKTRRSMRTRNSTVVYKMKETEEASVKVNREIQKESPPVTKKEKKEPIKEIPKPKESVKAKKIEAPKQINKEEPKPKKVIESEIFNHDFDDIKIQKKKEIREKLEFEKFTKRYEEFLQNKTLKRITDNIKKNSDYLKNNMNKLHDLLNFINSHDGFENVIGTNALEEFKSKSNYDSTVAELREEVDTYLFHYILYSNKSRHTENELISILNKNPKMLLSVPVIWAQDNESYEEITKKINDALKYDLVILRNFFPSFDLDNKKFSKDYISKKYNLKNPIDVISQKSEFVGFQKNKHERLNWELGKYFEYVNKQNSKPTDHKDEVVYYGVNVELTEYSDLYQELENRVHPLLVFGSIYDSLSYVRRHIPGMTIPQMYIKVKDVWTGGHEENLRMRSINISHGPGESRWWACPVADSNRLVKLVEDKYRFNIYKKEGIWFPEQNFFYDNNIPSYYSIQKAGDIVLVGAGTIHWVKAKSHAINTSWNFNHKDCYSLKLSMDRYEINRKIKFRSLVPMQTLLMDNLNREIFTLDVNYVKLCYSYIESVIKNSITEFNELKIFLGNNKKGLINYVKEPDNYMVTSCEECLVEIFNSWGYCQFCSTIQNEKVLCVGCFKIHIKSCLKPEMQCMYYKYEELELSKFIARVELKIKYDTELVSCNDEIKQVQEGLLKNTADSKIIKEKQLNKKIINEDLESIKKNTLLYKENDYSLISKLLVQLMDIEDPDKKIIYPLKSEKEGLFFDPYIDYEDTLEDINLKRFSPKRNEDDDNHSATSEKIDLNIENIGSMYQALNDGFKSNISKNPLEMTSLKSSEYQPNKASQVSGNRSNTLNMHSSIKGKTFMSLLNEDKSVHSKKSQSNDSNVDGNKVSNFKMLIDSMGPNVKDLEKDLKMKENANITMEDNPFIYNISRSSNKDASQVTVSVVNQLKRAKEMLAPLISSERCKEFKLVSYQSHSYIFEAKKLILENLTNLEAISEAEIKKFIEKIVNNENLISGYKEMFEEEIYSKLN